MTASNMPVMICMTKTTRARAAENIEPTGGFARDGMLGGFAKRGGELQTRVEPIADLLDQAHGSFPPISTSALGLLGLTGVGNSPALMNELPFFNFVRVFVKATFGRTRCASAVFVVDATVAGAHEKARLREPTNGAAEMHAIDGKDLKGAIVDAADPAVAVGGLAVPGLNVGIAESPKTRLAGGKLIERAERQPGLVAEFAGARDGGENVAKDGNGEKRGDDAVEKNSQFHEHGAPGKIIGQGHGSSPAGFVGLGYGRPANCGR